MSSIARHHNEWLSLLDVSGPFLSLPVLLRVLPQGLPAHEPDIARDLRAAHEEYLVYSVRFRNRVFIPLGSYVARIQRKRHVCILAMMLFLFVLVVGFIYEWMKGALEWD